MRRKKTEQAKLQEDVKEWEYEFDFFEEYAERAKYNEFQAEYYEWLAEEWGDDSFERKARVTRDCSKTWTIDFYKKNHLKQVVRVDRCKDPFCYNCQALRAQRRFETYAPILAKYEDDYDVYHIVLSVPNVSGTKLPGTVEWMLDRFGRVIEYFNGKKFAWKLGKEISGIHWVIGIDPLDKSGKFACAQQLCQFHDIRKHFFCHTVLQSSNGGSIQTISPPFPVL